MKASLYVKDKIHNDSKFLISGSKSESNRLLILQALFPEITIENLSISDDTKALQQGLKISKGTVDVSHAGTAMRFLTAYFASQEGKEIVLTGSERMQQRPIKVLVNALRDLGADIEYVKENGYPPLKISGKKLTKSSVEIEANVSSQYISALMLIAPSLPNGLKIILKEEIASQPYISMTMSLLKNIGISCSFSENKIEISPVSTIEKIKIEVESDWSSASYFYSIIALSENASVTLKNFRKENLQGDSLLSTIYENFGVKTTFDSTENTIKISKEKKELPTHLVLHLADTPDIAQTIAVTCFGLGLGCKLTGLKTLKIKETDRLLALKTELEKLGARVEVTDETLEAFPSERINKNISIDTYNDHRMAMAFAPLALKTDITINDAKVVSKSFPDFWEVLKTIGIKIYFQ